MLVCHEHKDTSDNKKVLKEFKDRYLQEFGENLPASFKNITMHSQANFVGIESEDDPNNRGIFMLQTIKIKGQNFNIFYDSGCSDLICKKSAINRLAKLGRATQIKPGPITISGVGDTQTVCEDGIYTVSLPLANGGDAVMQGLCLDKVTGDFPKFSLKNAEKTIRNHYQKSGGDFGELPCLPSKVGGEVDIMVGVKYLKYFPEQIFSLPTGLTIYNAAFNNYDGSKGVIAGPHASFTKDWEQVGQMAYSYNVRPEFPQFQAGNVATQLEEVEILKDTSLESKLSPTPTARAGVNIGGNAPCMRLNDAYIDRQIENIIQSPVYGGNPGAQPCSELSQLYLVKARTNHPKHTSAKKQGVNRFRLYSYSPQLDKCEIPHEESNPIITGSVVKTHSKQENPSFRTICPYCIAGGAPFLGKSVSEPVIYMCIACWILFPLPWPIVLLFIICQSYCPIMAYLPYWTGRPPSGHV